MHIEQLQNDIPACPHYMAIIGSQLLPAECTGGLCKKRRLAHLWFEFPLIIFCQKSYINLRTGKLKKLRFGDICFSPIWLH